MHMLYISSSLIAVEETTVVKIDLANHFGAS